MMSGQKKYAKPIRIWLFVGLVMLVVQVMVGGITRLTGSGLSITEWEIIQGTLPPLSAEAWDSEFELYRDSPQYREINEGMEMGSIFTAGTFKFIYFWEWVHRLWARVMGIVFLIPFIYFWSRGMFDAMLKVRLIGVFLLAGLAASFGWIMVASGLIERPWVNAYKLALHLSIAFLTYSWLLWTFFKTQWGGTASQQSYGLRLRFGRLAFWFTVLLCIQIFVGGVMSGMKAAVTYPTWPDMNGEFMPSVIFEASSWSWFNFNNYDQNLFMPALVQTIHRLVAYSVVIYAVVLLPKVIRMAADRLTKMGAYLVAVLLVMQVLLGIATVVNSKSTIPVGYGVAHQVMALFLLTACLHLNFRLSLVRDVPRET